MRNNNIDLLRVIGLSMIILAHTSPPLALFQLRNFDVPLMVMVSGAAFAISYKDQDYIQYSIKRLIRLLGPTWLFLTMLFTVNAIWGFPTQLPSPRKVAESYLLLDGIGYFWIIRVFILTALFAPIAYKAIKRYGYTKVTATLSIAFAAYSFIVTTQSFDHETIAYKVVENYLLYVIPYGLTFTLGMLASRNNNKAMFATFGATTLLFGLLAAYYYALHAEFTPTQLFKYPPQAYYLSYAIAVSSALFIMSERINRLIHAIKLQRLVEFIGKNSIWIYFWHIPFIQITTNTLHWRYLVVYTGALSICAAQSAIIKRATKMTTNKIILFICNKILAG